MPVEVLVGGAWAHGGFVQPTLVTFIALDRWKGFHTHHSQCVFCTLYATLALCPAVCATELPLQ
eukprot:5287960-Alexandrium_andersonii.AAC.1